jgi:hypothetical protein
MSARTEARRRRIRDARRAYLLLHIPPEQLALCEANPDATIRCLDVLDALDALEDAASTLLADARGLDDQLAANDLIHSRVQRVLADLDLRTIHAIRVPHQKVRGQLLPPIDQSIRFPSVNPDVATSNDPQLDASANNGHASKEEDDGNAEARTPRPC